jgi:hypothetical protein
MNEFLLFPRRGSDPFHRSSISHHIRTTIVGPTQTRIVPVSASARWEAGDDLDFHDDDCFPGLGGYYGDEERGNREEVTTRSGDELDDSPGPSGSYSSPVHHALGPVHYEPSSLLATRVEPQESPEPPTCESPMSSPSIYASTEMSHSPPRSIGSPLSDIQRFSLNHQSTIFVSPAFTPSRPASALTRAFETPPSVVQQQESPRSSSSTWQSPHRIRTKRVQFSSQETTSSTSITISESSLVLTPSERHRRRTMSYHFI